MAFLGIVLFSFIGGEIVQQSVAVPPSHRRAHGSALGPPGPHA